MDMTKLVDVFDLGSTFYRFNSCYPYMFSNFSKFSSRNSSNTLLLLSFFQLPFPSHSPSSSPLSKNKYSFLSKFFKVKPYTYISSLKSFSIPSFKSFYALQGKGRSSYLFSLSNFLRFERQIDIILIRSNLVSSIPHARSLIKNGFVYINGRQLSSYYLVQPGDIITLNSFFPISSKHVLPTPKYLIVNYSTHSIIFTSFNILDVPFFHKHFYKSLLDFYSS